MLQVTRSPSVDSLLLEAVAFRATGRLRAGSCLCDAMEVAAHYWVHYGCRLSSVHPDL